MSTRSENIRFNVYLNDKQAGNTMGNLYKQSRILKSELRKLKIGSQEWINKMKELKKVERSLTRVRAEMRNTNSTLSRMAGAFNKYFTMITAGIAGVVAAVYGIRQSTQVFSEFEKTLSNVMTLLSDSEKIKYRDFLKKGSIQIVKDYGFAVADTNKALFDAISAGVEAGNSIQFMNEASKLAIGGVTDLHTSVDGLTTVINAFKLTTDDAKDVSDAFFSAQKEGKTTVGELAAGIGKAAPLAHSLGISYQELLSATAALTKGGIDTESAFTYLRGVFSSMIKPSKELTKLFKTEFGHALNASEVKAIGFTRIMEEMNVLMQKYPNRLQSSVENVRALTAVTALSGKGLKEYQDILETVNNDIGTHSSLTKAFAEQEQTLSQNLEEAKGNLIAMTISLVEGFRPAIIGVTKTVSKFSHIMLKFGLWLKDHAQQVKFYAKALGVVLTSLATYRVVMAAVNAKVNIAIKLTGLMQNIALRAAIAYNRLTGNLGRAAAAQRVLNTTVKANPIGLLLSLLSMAGAAYLAFANRAKKATEEQKKLNEEIEHQRQLMNDNSDIEKRAKMMDMMTEGQIRRFQKDVENQLDEIDKVNEQKLLAAEKYNEEVRKLNERYANENAKTRAALFNNKYVTEARDKALAELQRLTKVESNLNKARLEGFKKLAEEKLKSFANTQNTNSNTNNYDPTDEEIKKLEELNKKIKELTHEGELDRMSAKEREIQQVKDKYAKLLQMAQGYPEQVKRLEELQNAELNRVKARQDAKYLAKKEEVQKKIEELSYNDQEKELAANKETFEKMIALAEQYGLDTTALLEQQKQNEQAIRDKYNKKEIDADKKKEEEKRKNRLRATNATLGLMNDIVAGAIENTDKESKRYKALAKFQIAINTAQAAINAYNSVVGTPYVGPILAPIAAAAAVAFGFLQMTKVDSTEMQTYAKGGIAVGASHSEGGIALIDSKSGKKVGEMEGGEPYMILSKETYKNNKNLINALLDSSLHRNGEPVDYTQPGYYPQPDLSGTITKLNASKYASGGVTNINHITNTKQGDVIVDNKEIKSVLYLILDALNDQKNKKVVVDIDGALQIKEAIEEIDRIESFR